MKDTDVFKNFAKIWGSIDEEPVFIDEKKRMMYLDSANVMGVVPKTKAATNIIRSWGIKPSKVPTLDFTPDSMAPIIGRYSRDYLKKALTLVTKSKEDSVTIMMKTGHPLLIASEEVDFILAPRVDPDNDLSKTIVELAFPVQEALGRFILSLKKANTLDEDIVAIKKYIIARVL